VRVELGGVDALRLDLSKNRKDVPRVASLEGIQSIINLLIVNLINLFILDCIIVIESVPDNCCEN